MNNFLDTTAKVERASVIVGYRLRGCNLASSTVNKQAHHCFGCMVVIKMLAAVI